MQQPRSSQRSIALAFQYVTVWNCWLAWVCSRFVPVLAGKSFFGGRRFSSWIPKWCNNHGIVAMLTHNDKRTCNQIAWRLFRRKFKGGAVRTLRYRNAGLELDYAPLLLKAIAEELNVLVGLRWMSKRAKLGRPVYLGTMAWPDTLDRRIPVAVGFFHSGTIWLCETAVALISLSVQFFRFAIAILTPRKARPPTDVVWFGIGRHEYGRYGQEACFYWPDRAGRWLRHLYVLPEIPDSRFQAVLKSENVQWIWRFEILRYCCKGSLAALGIRLMIAALSMLLPWRGSFILRARLCGYHFESLVWRQVGECLGAKAALSTGASWPLQSPYLIALQDAGFKTALWFYSANSISFLHPGGKPYFNERLRSVHEAERIFVWSRHNENWHRENLYGHPRNQVLSVGPMMCGDARKCLSRPNRSDRRLHIAVFDVTNVGGKALEKVGALHLPAEYQRVFWADVERLTGDFPESVLILKPKRSFRDPRRSFPDTFFGLLNNSYLKEANRLVFVPENADPYDAIARSDVVIAMPFTSPCLAAWHFGRFGIYYDPIGALGEHAYRGLGRYFCRSYADLCGLISEASLAKQEDRAPHLPEGMVDFIGRSQMSNPQETLLSDVSDWVLEQTRSSVVSRIPDPVAADDLVVR